MEFSLSDEHRMIRDLARRFVEDQLMPLEPAILDRVARGEEGAMTTPERQAVDDVAKSMGLWGLDAPLDAGGQDLPAIAMVGVFEELRRTIAPYVIPPDSPVIRMLRAVVSDRQRTAYLEPYVRGDLISATAISEPGAGSDPRRIATSAVREGEDWILNGQKLWISRADRADFTIVIATTKRDPGSRNALSAFLVDRGVPGFQVDRRIPMLGGMWTYSVTLDNCRVEGWKLLGDEGNGFGVMQLRLGARRIEIACWAVGMAQRALDMMSAHATMRVTFGQPLADRQIVQGWIADAATRIHAARLMIYHCAWKLDQETDATTELSMIKAFAVEMAWEVVDRAMQCFGAAGMSLELPLHLMAARLRMMRVYEGPTEIHNWVVARNVLRG
jgi:acyl-CoA dehydrogenase